MGNAHPEPDNGTRNGSPFVSRVVDAVSLCLLATGLYLAVYTPVTLWIEIAKSDSDMKYLAAWGGIASVIVGIPLVVLAYMMFTRVGRLRRRSQAFLIIGVTMVAIAVVLPGWISYRSEARMAAYRSSLTSYADRHWIALPNRTPTSVDPVDRSLCLHMEFVEPGPGNVDIDVDMIDARHFRVPGGGAVMEVWQQYGRVIRSQDEARHLLQFIDVRDPKLRFVGIRPGPPHRLSAGFGFSSHQARGTYWVAKDGSVFLELPAGTVVDMDR